MEHSQLKPAAVCAWGLNPKFNKCTSCIIKQLCLAWEASYLAYFYIRLTFHQSMRIKYKRYFYTSIYCVYIYLHPFLRLSENITCLLALLSLFVVNQENVTLLNMAYFRHSQWPVCPGRTETLRGSAVFVVFKWECSGGVLCCAVYCLHY